MSPAERHTFTPESACFEADVRCSQRISRLFNPQWSSRRGNSAFNYRRSPSSCGVLLSASNRRWIGETGGKDALVRLHVISHVTQEEKKTDIAFQEKETVD
jgi:hypothetical protein